MRHRKGKRYWRNLVSFGLCTLFLAFVGISVWLARVRAMVLVHPGRSSPAWTPDDLQVKDWEEVRFPSADGLRLGAWFLPPAPEGDGATLVYVHGLGSNRGELLRQAVTLSKYGYGALLLDLRNHGQSEGTLTTLGYAEVEDVRGAVTYLLERPEVNPNRIGLVGRSMGGAVVLRAAARIEPVRVVIAQCTYSSIDDNIREGVRAVTGLPAFPFAPLILWFGQREAGLNIRQVRPIDDLPQIAPRAVLFIHGGRDTIIDVSNSLRMYEAAEEPKELYLIPQAGHGGFMTAEPVEFERRVVRFLETYLRGQG